MSYTPNQSKYLTVAQTRTNRGTKDVKIILDVDTNVFYTLDDDNNFIPIAYSQSIDASAVSYDNINSGLNATNVQNGIDELSLIAAKVIKYSAAEYQMLIQSPTFTIASTASGVNFLRGYYITVYDDISFDRLAISISSGVSGNSIFGIYSLKDDGYPDELLYNTVVFNNTVIGGQLSNQNGTLTKGNYLVASSSSSNATFRGIAAQFLLNTFNFFGQTDGANLHVGLSVVYTYNGTLPTTFPSGAVKVTGGTTLPYLLFKTI
jgi:hypothetical protein